MVEAERGKAPFACFVDPISRSRLASLRYSRSATEFGGNDCLVTTLAEYFAEELFRLSTALDVRGIEVIDTSIKCRSDN